jgi:hypothetical protein
VRRVRPGLALHCIDRTLFLAGSERLAGRGTGSAHTRHAGRKSRYKQQHIAPHAPRVSGGSAVLEPRLDLSVHCSCCHYKWPPLEPWPLALQHSLHRVHKGRPPFENRHPMKAGVSLEAQAQSEISCPCKESSHTVVTILTELSRQLTEIINIGHRWLATEYVTACIIGTNNRFGQGKVFLHRVTSTTAVRHYDMVT